MEAPQAPPAPPPVLRTRSGKAALRDSTNACRAIAEESEGAEGGWGDAAPPPAAALRGVKRGLPPRDVRSACGAAAEAPASPRSPEEATRAALLRHRTLLLQARMREATADAAAAATGPLLPCPAHAGSSAASLRPVRADSGRSAASSASASSSAARAAAAYIAEHGPPSPRGSAMPTPGQELLGAFCGEAPFHKPRSYTLADWLEVWGAQVREAALAAGMHVWRAHGGRREEAGRRESGDGGATADAAAAAAEAAPPEEMQPQRAEAPDGAHDAAAQAA
jgi:hypothetical protein